MKITLSSIQLAINEIDSNASERRQRSCLRCFDGNIAGDTVIDLKALEFELQGLAATGILWQHWGLEVL